MAGIGFRLQRLMKEGTYLSTLKGMTFATFLVAGPWLVTIFSIALMNRFTILQGPDYEAFRAAVVYVYAFSLIFTGLYQMPVTRFLADEIYAGRLESVVPSFLGMVMCVAAIQALVGALHSLLFAQSVFFRAIYVSGLVVVSLLWLAMIFLSCLRDYQAVVGIFAGGALAGFLLSLPGERLFGLEGGMLGFFAGQALILLGLAYRILKELARPVAAPSFECLGALSRYRSHLWLGLLYNLGIWVDKLLFWFSGQGRLVSPGLYLCSGYDTPMFLAYVTAIPALGMFFLNVETTFYEAYREFFGVIEGRFPLRVIGRKQTEIKRTLRFAYQEMARVQGAITLLLFVFAPEIVHRIGYPPQIIPQLRWGLWGAYFQVLFLFASLSLLYFDFAREALWGTIVFSGANLVFTWITIVAGSPDWYGFGYFLSTLAAFLVTLHFLRGKLSELVFLTFMGNPYPGQRRARPPILGSDNRLGEIVFIRPKD